VVVSNQSFGVLSNFSWPSAYVPINEMIHMEAICGGAVVQCSFTRRVLNILDFKHFSLFRAISPLPGGPLGLSSACCGRMSQDGCVKSSMLTANLFPRRPYQCVDRKDTLAVWCGTVVTTFILNGDDRAVEFIPFRVVYCTCRPWVGALLTLIISSVTTALRL